VRPCMTAEEWRLWQEVNLRGASPCFDCTREFHLAMRAQGRCNGEPQDVGTPRLVSDDYERMRRRRQWRESSQRLRDRKKAAA